MSTRASYDLPDFPRSQLVRFPGGGDASARNIPSLSRSDGCGDDGIVLQIWRRCRGVSRKVNAVDSLQLRLKLYAEGKRNPDFGAMGESEFLVAPGNVEYLVDAANFAMIEFMHPAHPSAYFKATDADGSPGRVAQNTELYDRPTQLERQSRRGDGNL